MDKNESIRNSQVSLWIKQAADCIREELKKTAKNIKSRYIYIRSRWITHIYKKRPANGEKSIYVWVAVNRESGKVIDFEVGDRSKNTYFKLISKIQKNIE